MFRTYTWYVGASAITTTSWCGACYCASHVLSKPSIFQLCTNICTLSIMVSMTRICNPLPPMSVHEMANLQPLQPVYTIRKLGLWITRSLRSQLFPFKARAAGLSLFRLSFTKSMTKASFCLRPRLNRLQEARAFAHCPRSQL